MVTSFTHRPVPKKYVKIRQCTSSVQMAVNKPREKWIRKVHSWEGCDGSWSLEITPTKKLASNARTLMDASVVKIRVMILPCKSYNNLRPASCSAPAEETRKTQKYFSRVLEGIR